MARGLSGRRRSGGGACLRSPLAQTPLASGLLGAPVLLPVLLARRMTARIVANVQVGIPLAARRNTQILKAPAVRLARWCLANRMARRRTLEAAGIDRGVLTSGKSLARILIIVKISASRRTARRVSVRVVERTSSFVTRLPLVRGRA